MSRVYMILVKPTGTDKEWKFFTTNAHQGGRLYTKPPSPASIREAEWSYQGSRDTRVVYWDTDVDLLPHTDDSEVAYQALEAKLTKVGALAEAARVVAKDPPAPPVEGPVQKTKRKSRKKIKPPTPEELFEAQAAAIVASTGVCPIGPCGMLAGHFGPHDEKFRDRSDDCRRCGARDSACTGTCGDT